MDSSIFLEAKIVGAPQSVDTVRFMYAGGDHRRVVLRRQIVWNVEHDIADDTTDRRQRDRRDIFQRVLVGCRIFNLHVSASLE